MKKITTSLLIACFVALPSSAQGINQTQQYQQNRIDSGIANGSLSSKEAAYLHKKANRVSELEAKLRQSGGKLSKKERSRLSNELSDLNRQITAQKRDSNDRLGHNYKGNPPGAVGGPGAGKNWDYNPPGKAGGPGEGWTHTNPNHQGANPPGPAGGPGAGKNWNYNPPGKAGGPGKGWNYNNPNANYNNNGNGNGNGKGKGKGKGWKKKNWNYNPPGRRGGPGKGWNHN